MNSILWFRKGLRLHDNLALLEAIKGEVKNFYPVFVLDPHFMDSSRIGENRMRFLLQTLRDLDSNLRKKGSRLFVLKGKPVEVFPSVFKRWHIQKIAWEKDTEPYAIIRDKTIEKLAKENKIDVVITFGHTLFDLDALLKKNNGKPPMTYKGFQTLMTKAGMPQRPKDAPDQLPPYEMTKEDQPNEKSENWLENYSVPTLGCLPTYPAEEDVPEIPYKGGETVALERMEKYLSFKNQVLTFSKPETNAASMPKAVASALNGETTVLSPYIKFGSLSSRLFYWKLKDMYAKDSHSLPPVSLEGQLIWREFFYTAAYATPNFDKMVGNPICKQIPWTNDEKFIDAWKNAKTGFPWIDAIMTQLKTEGWIHHLARHSVACFLTRGDLWVSWEKGRDIFDLWLLDDDWSLNNANWMWLSCSSFFYKYFRVYSPVAFAKKYDPEGKYIKKYLPVLKNMPTKYILEPWKAPESVQKTAKCIIGKDYPKPIVDHAEASKRCINAMKDAYANQAKTTTSNNNNTNNEDENENEVVNEQEEEEIEENSKKNNEKSMASNYKVLGQKRKATGELNKEKSDTKRIKITK